MKTTLTNERFVKPNCKTIPQIIIRKIFFAILLFASTQSTFAQATYCYADKDGDGFGDPNKRVLSILGICDDIFRTSSSNNLDCDDNDPNINPNTKWYKDLDGDFYPDSTILTQCEAPAGYTRVARLEIDCNDNDKEINPGTIWRIDSDGDGYYSRILPGSTGCYPPYLSDSRYIPITRTLGFDCNDGDARVKEEAIAWYRDNDGDGYPLFLEIACRPTRGGYLTAKDFAQPIVLDCDDNDALNKPICYFDIDGDGYTSGDSIFSCDPPVGYIKNPKRNIDNSLLIDCNDVSKVEYPKQAWIRDEDGDGHGAGLLVGGFVLFQCTRPNGYFVANELLSDMDCNDHDASINPKTLWVLDADRDGYKNKLYFASPEGSCTPPQDGRHYIINSKGSDCDDNDPLYNPESIWVIDADRDGYYTGDPYKGCLMFAGSEYVLKTTQQPGDCNDNDASINPKTLWVLDADGDGYREQNYLASPEGSCTPPQDGRHYINNPKGSDCDDNDKLNNPESVWVIDADGDGYYTGEPYYGCLRFGGLGYVLKTTQLSGDCNDGDRFINLSATEVADGIDNNCDGNIDEGLCSITMRTKNVTAQIDAGGVAVIADRDVDNGSSATCGIASYSLSKTRFFCENLGQNTVTLTVTDVNGNSATGTAIVTVEDRTKPVVITKSITVQIDPGGIAVIADRDVDNGSYDPCGLVLYKLDKTRFDCSNIGQNTVTLTVTDINGNSASGTAIVTVEDRTKPVVITKSITAQIDPGGIAVIADRDVDNGSYDPCGLVLYKLDKTRFDCSNIGQNTVTLTVTDINGNSASGTAIVTVEDRTKPVVITKSITAQIDPGGIAVIADRDVDNGSYDPCGLVLYKLDKTRFDCSNIGQNTVTLTVTDINGNSASGTAIVTVEDRTKPVVITKSITAQIDPGGIAVIADRDVDNGSYDPCGLVLYKLDKTRFDCSNIGQNTVTLTVTDINGNSASGTAIVTVEDRTKPVVITKSITAQIDPGGIAVIADRDVDDGSYDPCGLVLYKLDKTRFDCSNIGQNTVTLTVTDINGNSASGTAIVTVEDRALPTVITKNITVQLDPSGSVTVADRAVDNGSYDPCGLVSYKLDKTTFTCFDVGQNTVTLTVTDINGNKASGTAIITVQGKGPTSWIVDNDKDGYYAGTLVVQCTSPGAGYIILTNQLAGDCNDNDATINPVLIPSVSLDVSTGTTICSGSEATFTATPTKGGTAPSYKWTIGLDVQPETGATLIRRNLANNDVVKVVMTSNATCASPTTATDMKTMTVNPVLPPSVRLGISTGTAICAGTLVTFTATPTNGGVSPTYKWTIGTMVQPETGATLTRSNLVNNDVVRIEMTSSVVCISPSKVSASATMFVKALPNAAISIAETSGTANNDGNICAGASAQLTASGGSTYKWNTNATTSEITATTSGNYTVSVTTNGCTSIASKIITVNPRIQITGTNCPYVYYGYGSNCINISAIATGGSGSFSYNWSPGNLSGATINICPTKSTEYTVSATDQNGCKASAEMGVNVIDVSCNNNKVKICHNGKTLCIDKTAIPNHLAHGDKLGTCGTKLCDDESSSFVTTTLISNNALFSDINVLLYPNPAKSEITLQISGTTEGDAQFDIMDISGRILKTERRNLLDGLNSVNLDINTLAKGLHFIKIKDSGNQEVVVKMNKL